jgi:hypothetical protein
MMTSLVRIGLSLKVAAVDGATQIVRTNVGSRAAIGQRLTSLPRILNAARKMGGALLKNQPISVRIYIRDVSQGLRH